MKPLPEEIGRVFSDFLYREHQGHRVLADVEGCGLYRARSDSAIVWVDDDDQLACEDAVSGAFGKSLVVIGEKAAVSVLMGACEWPSGGTLVKLPFEGSGYLLEGLGVAVDGGAKRRDCPLGGVLPFFQSLQGPNEVRVVLTGAPCLRLVDTWSIRTVALESERRFTSQNLSAISVLKSGFDCDGQFEAPVASHLNAVAWNVQLPEGTVGLRLRKTYDRFHGRQRARVMIDGEFAGWWYEPVENRVHRWDEAEFGVSGRFVRGKRVIRIAIDPPSGSPPWSVSKMEVLAVTEPAR